MQEVLRDLLDWIYVQLILLTWDSSLQSDRVCHTSSTTALSEPDCHSSMVDSWVDVLGDEVFEHSERDSDSH